MIPEDIKEYDENDKWNIGKRIQDVRVKLNLKASDVAAYLKIGINQYSRIENGRANCTIPQIFVLTQVLDCSVDYLLFGREPALNEEQQQAINAVFSAFGKK